LLGKKIEPSKGSVLQPAMRLIQEKLNHRNERGEIISLSAWRQWHVERDGQLKPVLEPKDPSLVALLAIRARVHLNNVSLASIKSSEMIT
jgi:hypothetical protein